jgi:hypothetical protein
MTAIERLQMLNGLGLSILTQNGFSSRSRLRRLVNNAAIEQRRYI